MGGQNELENPATLNGWKDIATYLGKSVRAVQRWEHDFGLPVHRIKTPTGQVVYAFRAEVDAWRVAMRSRPSEEQPESARGELPRSAVEPPVNSAAAESVPAIAAAPSHAPVAQAVPRPRLMWMSGLGAAALAVIIGGLLITKAGARPLTATRYEITGTALIALTDARLPVWSHDFGWQPQPLKHGGPPAMRTVAADLDGDGHQELLALIHAPGSSGEPWRESIFCFSDTGTLRWSYTPSVKLSYEGRSFEGPWRNYALTASAGPGRQRVWVSYGHHTWWPSFVVELDAAGKVTPRYFQSGAIYGLTHWSAGSGEYLVATGVNNEYASASVAVLAIDAPAATSPQHAGTGFHCDSCPSEGPSFFAALPRTELNRLSGSPYNFSAGATPNGNDLKIYAEELAGDARSAAAAALYYLRDDFTLHDLGLSDSYGESHRKLEIEGKISHSFKDCPDRRIPLTPRTWSRARGWQQASVVSGAPPSR